MKSLSNNSDNELVMSPSMRREWIEMRRTIRTKNRRKSPSMRREWIEISFAVNYGKTWEVSLHAEGVD